MANFQYKESPFSFSFASTRTGEMLIDSVGQTFVFQDKFIQVDMKVPTAHIYGFGERARGFELGRGAWTMWSQGADAEYDDGTGGKQLAGMHPFCLIKASASDEFFGIFFRSTNAQAPIVTYRDDYNLLSYVTTGGNLDINFFGRGTAKEVIANYQKFIGTPTLPPFWALGWHASSNEWDSLDDLQGIVQKYEDAGVPLETVWLDGKYMEGFADFTVAASFAGLKEYTEALHSWGKKLVVMLYGGLAADRPSQYITAAEGALIQGFNGSMEDFEAQTFANRTRFLDWFHDGAAPVWERGLFDLFDKVAYDGLWLDMNAPTIFCDGGQPLCGEDRDVRKAAEQAADPDVDYSWYQTFGSAFQGAESTYFLPFIPQKNNLDRWTISLNATHNYTAGNKTLREYDVHSLFGHMQAKTTRDILTNASANAGHNVNSDYRKFISSTSTFAGTGQYAQHHLAKQKRTWEHMRYSIAGVMNFNMFGIPFTGADVCGAEAASEDQPVEEQQEICARWYQLSTFYPLARTNRDAANGGISVNPFDLWGNKSYEIIA
jgi:alpha-glucosidase (family GH31 glycosyl hydrolase)